MARTLDGADLLQGTQVGQHLCQVMMATQRQAAHIDLVPHALEVGERVLERYTSTHRKQFGQFMTPVAVARFMARQLPVPPDGARVLDPAIGSGVLACALIERVVREQRPISLWIDGYEVDAALCETAQAVLDLATRQAAEYGIRIYGNVYRRDFVLDHSHSIQMPLFSTDSGSTNLAAGSQNYDAIIANPPYLKLNTEDPRVKAVAGNIPGYTNIYTLFMALAVKKLAPLGRACFIVPRSFCSGAYFSAFRRDFIREAVPIGIHLFDSRADTFKSDSVLQENVIFTFRRRGARESDVLSPGFLDLSTSHDASDLEDDIMRRRISMNHFLGRRNGSFLFRVPAGELDEQIVEAVDAWSGSLNHYGLKVSTGPVVPFRARALLGDAQAVERGQAVPLLWMQNVKPQRIEWPLPNHKPQSILRTGEDTSLLVRTGNYVLLRRFSSKEDRRRLVAAPLLVEQFDYDWLGLENHLNYIYKEGGELTPEEVLGLSAVFNSALMDRYIRIANGNTQVNAVELRALPLPPLDLLSRMGVQLRTAEAEGAVVDLDRLVFSTLRDTGHLLMDIPTIKETRFTMGKIQEAQAVLKALGLPRAQQTEAAALTLLVLAQLSEETPWREAERKNLRIHDILGEIKERYQREYAENTRETIRRQIIHQFIQAGVVIRNPDDPSLPTNSPRTHYSLSPLALQTLRAYGTDEWQQVVQAYVQAKGSLFEIYQKPRDQHKVPLRLADGSAYYLSPGKHNTLQAAVINEFSPRFAPGAELLYLGDTEHKTLISNETVFEELGVPIPSHDKLPDIVLYQRDRNWLFLIEVVTSHGPVSHKRHHELEEVFKGCPAGRVYVSAFPDFATFKSFLADIAWETEVWLAEMPSHLIHFNGDRFLGPYNG